MLGHIIGRLRNDYGMTQEDLALKLHVARSTVAGWESNAKEPNLDMLKKIADLFNVSCDFLLGRTDEMVNLNLYHSHNKEILLKVNSILQGYNISKK